MNKGTLLNMLYLLALLSPYSLSHAGNSAAPKIVDRGMDGGTRIFTIYCAGGKRTSVQSHHLNDGRHTAGQICYDNRNGQSNCTASSVTQAAIRACRARQ